MILRKENKSELTIVIFIFASGKPFFGPRLSRDDQMFKELVADVSALSAYFLLYLFYSFCFILLFVLLSVSFSASFWAVSQLI